MKFIYKYGNIMKKWLRNNLLLKINIFLTIYFNTKVLGLVTEVLTLKDRLTSHVIL
jgi:hypothetical protein